MLQLLNLDVSKLDQRLHMGCACEAAGDAGNVRGGTGPLLGCSLAREYRSMLAPCIECPGASKSVNINAATMERANT
jgi:hypothetical protein